MPVFCSEELRCVSWRVICVANAGEPVNRMSETANIAGTLRNRRILSLHSLLSPGDVAQRRRPDINDPTYCLRHSNRCARWIDGSASENGCAGLVREHDSGAVNLHGSVDLVGW